MKNKLMSLLCGLVLFSGIAEAGTAIHYYAPNDPANLLVVNTNFENVVGRLDAIYPDATTGLGSWLYLWTNDIRGIDNLIGVGSGYITNFSELYINESSLDGFTFSISAQILNPTSSIPDNLIVFEQGSSEAYTITNLTGSAMVSGEVTANFWTANPTNILGNHTINYTGLVFNTVYTNVVVNIPVSAGFRSGWDITATDNATNWIPSAGAYRQ